MNRIGWCANSYRLQVSRSLAPPRGRSTGRATRASSSLPQSRRRCVDRTRAAGLTEPGRQRRIAASTSGLRLLMTAHDER